jgi:hypothetical protein
MTQPLSTSRQVPLSWVESLFARMQSMYGNKFLDMWRGADIDKVKALWSEEMGKLTNAELKRGVDSLMTREWPPTLPEYVKLCRPAIDATVAYYEAIAGLQARDKGQIGEWSHQAIFWAAAKLSFDLKNQTYSTVRARWEKTFADEMEKGQWADIPAPMIALPQPEISREKAAHLLEELGAAKVMHPKTDHKLWAKRIVERDKRGDKTLTVLQVRFAKEALAATT